MQDTFEDAVDTAEVRTLTKRNPSMVKGQPSKTGEAKAVEEHAEADADKDESIPIESGTKSAAVSHRISNTQNLDNVNLDDESAPQQQGSLALAA